MILDRFTHFLRHMKLFEPDCVWRFNRFSRLLVTVILTLVLIISFSQTTPVSAQSVSYCQLSNEAVNQKNNIRQAALRGDRTAQQQYQSLIRQHSQQVQNCHRQSWLKQQAVWIRLYSCDALPGQLETILDDLVNKGYNQVYVEVFYNGQVLLPAANNPTAFPSVIRTPGYEQRDLLAESIAKGRERGLKVYAWMFTLNFGYNYTQRSGAEQVLARNGYGQTSLDVRNASSVNGGLGGVGAEETFIDPYHPQAKRDYSAVVQAVAQRQPDGVLFDYIRYPRGTGSASVASRVQNLWVYGVAAQQTLLSRGENQSGQELIRRFLTRGYITTQDVVDVKRLFPQDGYPRWQGFNGVVPPPTATPAQLQSMFQWQLWQLSVAHAIQGVLDFLSTALLPLQPQNIDAGVVFFPEANQTIGQGYDSRLQPWDRFPSSLEWHPMSYATCGNTSCIVAQVRRVLSQAPAGTQVMPVLAGTWAQAVNGRPSLEAQMASIHQVAPQIHSISHFAYSWQEPQFDRDRKFCQLR